MYEKFAKLVEAQGVSAYKVSKETGISQATLSQWKSGQYELKADKLQKIADYFDVPLAYFYGEDVEPYYFDEETAKLAQSIYEDKDLRILLDAKRSLKEEDLRLVVNMIQSLKEKEGK